MGHPRQIAQRHLERLGTTDVGIIMYREMIKREIAKVQAGQDPIGRSATRRRTCASRFPLERNKAHFIDGFSSLLRRSHARYSPIADDLSAVFAAYNDEALLEKYGSNP